MSQNKRKKYANGGKIDPPIKSKGLTPEQQSEAEADVLWTNRWNANRVVAGKSLGKSYQISPNQVVQAGDLSTEQESGRYDPNTRIVTLDPTSTEQGVPAHEYAHIFQDRTKLTRPKIYQDYINNPITKMLPNTGTYETNPNEIHSELMRLRRNSNFQPDQVITPNDISEDQLSKYNFNNLNKDNLIELLNSTADNTVLPNPNIQTARLGGLLTNNMRKQYALGGELTQFNEGGTHEQNPNGGVPMGQGASVEQGETKMSTPDGQFIFSDRIQITPTVANTLNLPKSWIGKTMADYSKKLDSQFKDRNDNLSRTTKQRMLDRGAQVQEAIKAEQEALAQAQNTNALQAPEDMMNGQIPSGMEEYTDTPMALGGYVRKQMFGGGPVEDVKPTIVTNEGQLEASKLKNDALNQKLQPYVSAYNAIAPTVANMVNPEGGDAKRTQTLQSINTIGSGVGSAIGGAAGSTVGRVVTGATGLYDMGSEAFGRSNVDTSGVQSQSGADAGKSAGAGALKGAATGATLGSVIPGVGTLIGAGVGAVLGGVSGFVGGKKDEKAQIKNNNLYSMNYNKRFSDQYALGGMITSKELLDSAQLRKASQNNAQYAVGGKIKNPKVTSVNSLNPVGLQNTVNDPFGLNNRFPKPTPVTDTSYPSLLNNFDTSSEIPLPQIIESATIPSQTQAQFEQYANANTRSINPTLMDRLGIFAKKAEPYVNKAGDKLGNALRYAPLAMDAYQLSKLKKPQGERLNRLSNRYVPTYTDLAAQQNIVNQELGNVSSAIQGSGASQGAIRANLLGAQLNKSKALSQAYSDAEARNAQQNALAQQFNLGVDSTNLNQANSEQDINARNLGNYETQKSRLLGNIGTTAGEIGKEEKFKGMVKGMFGYDANGRYVIDPEGKKVYVASITSEKKALGGIVMKKRK